jgi:hypothetical protein
MKNNPSSLSQKVYISHLFSSNGPEEYVPGELKGTGKRRPLLFFLSKILQYFLGCGTVRFSPVTPEMYSEPNKALNKEEVVDVS